MRVSHEEISMKEWKAMGWLVVKRMKDDMGDEWCHEMMSEQRSRRIYDWLVLVINLWLVALAFVVGSLHSQKFLN